MYCDLKKGDIVVCVRPYFFECDGSYFKDVSDRLTLNEKYIVTHDSGIFDNMVYIDDGYVYNKVRFIKLSELRKGKLKKISADE